MSFANSLKKGYYFLNFEDEKQRVIKPTYAKGSLWLSIIGFTNSLCARFTYMTTRHASIDTDRDSFPISLPAILVIKLRFKPKNTLSWHMTCMTLSCDHITSLLTALFTFSQITLEPLVLAMDKVPLWCNSME